jgi:hypothetical protein
VKLLDIRNVRPADVAEWANIFIGPGLGDVLAGVQGMKLHEWDVGWGRYHDLPTAVWMRTSALFGGELPAVFEETVVFDPRIQYVIHCDRQGLHAFGKRVVNWRGVPYSEHEEYGQLSDEDFAPIYVRTWLEEVTEGHKKTLARREGITVAPGPMFFDNDSVTRHSQDAAKIWQPYALCHLIKEETVLPTMLLFDLLHRLSRMGFVLVMCGSREVDAQRIGNASWELYMAMVEELRSRHGTDSVVMIDQEPSLAKTWAYAKGAALTICEQSSMAFVFCRNAGRGIYFYNDDDTPGNEAQMIDWAGADGNLFIVESGSELRDSVQKATDALRRATEFAREHVQ